MWSDGSLDLLGTMADVTPYDRLTERGRRARIASLAADAVRHRYGLEPAGVSVLVGHSFNTLVRADLRDGRRVVVRVGDALRIHADGLEDVEAAWLAALSSDGFRVAGMERDLAGRPTTVVRIPAVPGPRHVAVFSWLPGRPIRDRMTPDRMARAGELFALLHAQAAAMTPIQVPAGVRADRAIFFRDRTAIDRIGPPHQRLLDEAIARSQAILDQLWAHPPHPPHVLHGDFGPHNVLSWRGRLEPIDFQDLRLGFEIQDVGISQADLLRWEPEMLGPFRSGYERQRPWPLDPESADAFGALRSLDLINLGLNLRRPGLAEFLERHIEHVAGWMASPGGRQPPRQASFRR